MPIDITINSITGTSPYNVFLCDTGLTLCVYISQITNGDLPYTFQPPALLASLGAFTVKIIDSAQPCSIIVDPIPFPILSECSPIYLNSTDFKLYSFETSAYTTNFYFDPGFIPSAMTRSDSRLWLYDGSSFIYEYDTTASTIPTLIRQIDTSTYGINIFGMCPFTSTTELLVSESTDNISVLDISSNIGSITSTLYTTGGNNQYCNLLRDNNIGITYVKKDSIVLKGFYDDGTEYSSGSWPIGYLSGLFRDPITAEIYGINQLGFYEQVTQSPGLMAFIPVGTISPYNTVGVGVAQSDSCIAPLISVKFFVSNITAQTLTLTSSTFSWVNWGDSQYISGSTGAYTITPAHNYSSPFNGYFTLNSYNRITGLSIPDPGLYTGAIKLTAFTSELEKLVGLERLTSQTTVVVDGLLSELPRELIFFQSNPTKLYGQTSDLPPLLEYLALSNNSPGLIFGDVINLPSGLTTCSLSSYINISGFTQDLPRNLINLRIVSTDYISGDTIDLPINLVSIYIALSNNRIYGDTLNLPRDLIYLGIEGYNTISGNTSDLPSGLTFTYLVSNTNLPGESTTISGDTSGLPRSSDIFIGGLNTISGDVKDLPNTISSGPSSPSIKIFGNNTISGDIGGYPNNIKILEIAQATSNLTGNTISGDIKGLSGTPLNRVIIYGANIISGDTIDLNTTSSFTYLDVRGFNTITGDISNIPSNLTSFIIYGNNTIYGDISGFPGSTIQTFDVRGNNSISGSWSSFTPSTLVNFVLSGGNIDVSPNSALGMSFPSGMRYFQWTPTGASPDVTIIDDILFAATAQTSWSTFATPYGLGITLNGTCPSPSVAGLAAKALLTGSPYNLTVITN